MRAEFQPKDQLCSQWSLGSGLKAFELASRSLAVGRLAEDALKKITGKDLNQGTNGLWARWWEKAGIHEERGNPPPLAAGSARLRQMPQRRRDPVWLCSAYRYVCLLKMRNSNRGMARSLFLEKW